MRDAENNLRDDGIERTLGSGWRDWANIRVGMTGLSENLVGMTGLSEHKGREEGISEHLVRDEGIKDPYWGITIMFVGLN